ncbi:cell division protein FtsL [Marinibacterium profundimaris]|uniref:Cell division protein FtsL n=1 Tax=Marinibacterium profundimaris TaxID=1679460 RepID=A0A225NT15_9RHOB|nr:cell division protein FtsL [Marinibacterium profundimaris]OWU77985.1 cell division protein FtsL [Marinibacterium profundimaris]
MKGLLYILTALAVFGLAFWAYRENYATQEVLSETQSLQRQIGSAQARLAVLKAEWAYLNRPDRLRELAEINFDRLGLLPLRPDQFGYVDEVGYPKPASESPLFDIDSAVDVSNTKDMQIP